MNIDQRKMKNIIKCFINTLLEHATISLEVPDRLETYFFFNNTFQLNVMEGSPEVVRKEKKWRRREKILRNVGLKGKEEGFQ